MTFCWITSLSGRQTVAHNHKKGHDRTLSAGLWNVDKKNKKKQNKIKMTDSFANNETELPSIRRISKFACPWLRDQQILFEKSIHIPTYTATFEYFVKGKISNSAASFPVWISRLHLFFRLGYWLGLLLLLLINRIPATPPAWNEMKRFFGVRLLAQQSGCDVEYGRPSSVWKM